jgi:predicted GNAT family acetyltransferase
MAGCSGPLPSGIRINAVYTPPELRGRGYASACVAALSQMLLEEGRKFCFLYTDVENETANDVYRAIGYRRMCDVEVIAFEE